MVSFSNKQNRWGGIKSGLFSWQASVLATVATFSENHVLSANNVTIPKFDVPPALICVWLWVVSCMISTNIEV